MKHGSRKEVRLWLLQRLSAAVLGLLVLVHLGGMVLVAQNELSAAEILARTRGSGMAVAFYGCFVLACAVHAGLGIRTVAAESTRLRGAPADWLAGGFALAVLVLGLRAVWAVTA